MFRFKIHCLIITFLMLFMLSCSPSKMNKNEFLTYYNKGASEYTKVSSNGLIIIESSYLPNSLIAINDDAGNNISAYDSAYYFKIIIRPKEGHSFREILQTKQNYYNLNHYINSSLGSDFTIHIDNKPYENLLCFAENKVVENDKIIATISMNRPMLEDLNSDMELVFEDHFFNTGTHKFHYSKNSINNINNITII